MLADAKSLQKYVSRADKRRLDEYFESIRALEKRIEFSEKQTTEVRSDRALTDTLTTPSSWDPLRPPGVRTAYARHDRSGFLVRRDPRVDVYV